MFEMQIAQLNVFLYAIVPNLYWYISIYLLFLLQIYLYLDWNFFEACIPLLQLCIKINIHAQHRFIPMLEDAMERNPNKNSIM